MTPESPPAPYRGLRMVDAGGLLSAYGTRLLAAQGMEVLVPEPPGGHPMRRWPPLAPGVAAPEESLWWAYLSQGKKSVVFRQDGDLQRLMANADVVVEGDGCIVRDLKAHAREDVVWITVSPFGRSGPRANWRGSELVAWASSGLLYSTGFPDRPPVVPGGNVQLAHHLTSMYVAIATQLALRGRQRFASGENVEISMQEACLEVSVEVGPLGFLDDLVPRRRTGNRRITVRPLGLYPCADGHVSLCPMQPGQWAALARWIHEVTGDERILDEALNTMSTRYLLGEFVDNMTEDLTRQYGRMYLFAEGQRRGIPCTPVNTIADLLADPHLEAARYWRTEEHPAIGSLLCPGNPNSASWWQWARAPLLGEHNHLLCEPSE